MSKENKEQKATLDFILNQYAMGFEPRFMVTYHYYHPSERIRRIKEKNDKSIERWGFKTTNNIWHEVPSYNYFTRRRNCYDSILEDTSQVKTIILKKLFGIKRPNQTWKYEHPTMLFFHEKGKVKLQYHTHLLLPEMPDMYNSVDKLELAFNVQIQKSRKCFSRWKNIHIKYIDNPVDIANYLVKEVSSTHQSLDYRNSIFAHEK